ncbi:ribulose-phosphate 3-epimerase [Macrococcoides bohemicum]|uniref:Ribulose-phosphate 3-epimerase n=1 Tax=Macrococcoides bohemicum TaxID=1903056 RepID=A0A4R5Y145_9STAP|nr:ribulose-phosphate 3-epimerase [Macrococcus bohemicus]MBC9875098.1 ribulose-phosphate 3-epimerase [Macrococcus bohemicus]QRN49665.1 ribulose-phosphate 3-epimerase [Macrococcus bohemicus]QYA43564.1 ribulose-phosphate 3-epimerase [Macrococcus bohemicus]QYA45950.1 ribulose-phosphate 3-epimerase [Macrococcus bohemicus]TDL36955.1 ribulose-phosphate 3-epimerase [Macrococcus bohemicus]
MMKVAPSLLSCNFLNIQQEIKRLEEAGVDYIHFDVMDGNFVPNISFAFPILNQIRQVTDLTIDTHLMVQDPERYIQTFAEAGSDIITVHVEATNHIHRAIQMIHDTGKKAGVTLNPGTPIESVVPVLKDIDLVLVMTVNPGFGGQKFIDNGIEKIKFLKDYKEKYHLNYEIEVDGGVNEVTAKTCIEAGADVLVAGSYFFKHKDLSIPTSVLRGE